LIIVAGLALLPGQAQADGTPLGASTLEPRESFQECDVCPVMIALPLGEFTMGGPPGESRLTINLEPGNVRPVTPEDPYIAKQEGPMHRVTVDLPIAMARDELTFGEWNACVADGGCGGYSPETSIMATRAEWRNGRIVLLRPERIELGDRHPVSQISYDDIQLYLEWLNTKVGADVYRLPTEAEWEYAARSGTQTPFAQGNEVNADQANFEGMTTEQMLGVRRPDFASRGHPVPVDELDAANAWGLRHMSGNLIEHTASCWTDRHAGWPLSSIHLEMAQTTSCLRVAKGGDFSLNMDFSRPGYRGRAVEHHRSRYSGFRVVRALSPMPGD